MVIILDPPIFKAIVRELDLLRSAGLAALGLTRRAERVELSTLTVA